MRLEILIVIATLVVSCNNSQESQSHIPRDITDEVDIVTIDSCDYITIIRAVAQRELQILQRKEINKTF